MILIPAGAYVEGSLEAELGRLPPTFVPFANKRLFHHQLPVLRRAFGDDVVIVMSLPRGFSVGAHDAAVLRQANCAIVEIDAGLSLAESILSALRSSGLHDDRLLILHGDTLAHPIPTAGDVIGVGRAYGDYPWEFDDTADEAEKVAWCGLFSFESPALFVDLLEAGCNFVDAVRAYDRRRPLKRVLMERWSDFGHVNTYYLSRGTATTQRAFNALDISRNVVTKSGSDREKLRAEVSWYRSIPTELRIHCPQVLNVIDNESAMCYQLEYLSCLPLNELFVHGRRSLYAWKHTLRLCVDFLQAAAAALPKLSGDELALLDEQFVELAERKSIARLGLYAATSQVDLRTPLVINGVQTPSIVEIVDECVGVLAASRSRPAVVHGDFCFSNVLLDSRLDLVKVIDPRGGGLRNCLGDQRYDVAKMSHSVLGMYDFIIAGDFDCVASGRSFELALPITDSVQDVMSSYESLEASDGLAISDSHALVVLLFLSMLPLHADAPGRQTALLANALRYYVRYVGAGRGVA